MGRSAPLVGADVWVRPPDAALVALRRAGRVGLVADLIARLDETEAGLGALPHRRKYLLLVTGFLRRLLELHLEFVDELEGDSLRGEETRVESAGRTSAPD